MPTDPTRSIGASGPVQYSGIGATHGRALFGGIQYLVTPTRSPAITRTDFYASASSFPASRTRDLTGPVFISNISGSQYYQWPTVDGWDSWGGYKRAFGNQMRLAFNSMVNVLGISSTKFYYRPGTIRSLQNTPSNGRDGVFTGTAGMAVSVGGVQGKAGAGIIVGGAASDYRLTEEVSDTYPVPPVPAGDCNSFVFGGWFRWSPNPGFTQSAFFGYDHLNYDNGSGSIVQAALAEFGMGTGYLYLNASISDDLINNGYPTVQLSQSVSFTAGDLHFLMVHVFFTRDSSGNYHSYVRFIADGVLLHEYSSDNGDFYPFNPFTMSTLGSFPPMIMAESRSNGGAYEQSGPFVDGWGTPAVVDSYRGEADEMFWAEADPFGITGGTLIDGDSMFTAVRHPDPFTEGTTSTKFVMYSPVINTLGSASSGVSQVRAKFDTLLSGQQIDVSVRASTTSFGATDSSPAWSSWWDLNTYNNTWRSVGGGGSGPYVQIRIRMLPSNDSICQNSPALNELDVQIYDDARGAGSLDIEGQINIGTYVMLEGQILVRQTGQVDLEGQIKVRYAGTPVNLEGQISIFITSHVDLEGTLKITPMTLLEGQVTIQRPTVSVNLEGQIYVIRPSGNPGSLDFEGQIFVLAKLNFEGQINVQALMLEGQITVKQTGQVTFEGQINVPVDTPTAVTNLTSNLPRGVWQRDPDASFTWGAATDVRSSIEGYYWILTEASGAPADLTWNRTDVFAVSLDISSPSYGPGIWFFKVAARNVLGYFGPVSTYEVRWDEAPTPPGTTYMKINTKDTLLQSPLIPSAGNTPPQLTWTPSTPFDPESTLIYEVQFATQADFGFNFTLGRSSIALDIPNIPGPVFNWTNLLNPGRWFWRIRATDGREFSDWSQVGSFVLNAPPPAPTGILVIELD